MQALAKRMEAPGAGAYMSAGMTDDLYSLDVLRLASAIPRMGALDNPQASVRKASKLCGSWLELDLDMADGAVSDAAARLQACALGQASAAILMESIIGATEAELTEARDALKAMLKSGGAPPDGRFEKLKALEQVRDYPQRHASTLLAFEAAAEAAALASRSAA